MKNIGYKINNTETNTYTIFYHEKLEMFSRVLRWKSSVEAFAVYTAKTAIKLVKNTSLQNSTSMPMFLNYSS